MARIPWESKTLNTWLLLIIYCLTTGHMNLNKGTALTYNSLTLQKDASVPTVKNFEDVCFPTDPASPTPRCQFYMRWCPGWLLAPLLSNRASEIGVITSPDHFKDAAQVEIDEEDGVIFPDATRFTGFAIDYTIQRGKVRGLRDGRLPVVWFEVFYSTSHRPFAHFMLK